MLIQVNCKHGAKAHPIVVDTDKSAVAFKEAIYQSTGVPASRMKVMVKGILKDDADMAQLGLTEGQSILVIGTAGSIPAAPAQVTVFAEDAEENGMDGASVEPPGLVNLGNTCYMNASLQALRIVPELDEALARYQPAGAVNASERLTQQAKLLFRAMSSSANAVPPAMFLQALRQVSPQFAEMGQHGGYAQQDADEMWTQTVSTLNTCLKSPDDASVGFMDSKMSIVLQQTMTCDEAPEEPSTSRAEKLMKLDCNISASINYMMDGIKESLDQKVEKMSPSLDRTALYTQSSRISELPATMTIHMVRFYWRADIQKKAKIMRKVKFPMDLDIGDLLADDLKQSLQPAKLALQEIFKARQERARVAKKTKSVQTPAATASNGGGFTEGQSSDSLTVASKGEGEEHLRRLEQESFQSITSKQGSQSSSGNNTGLYELSAVVTHKGASADSGHYIGWTRKDTAPGAIPGDEDWWKYDDDKVSTVTKEQILGLDGGGEASIAYILVYRTKKP